MVQVIALTPLASSQFLLGAEAMLEQAVLPCGFLCSVALLLRAWALRERSESLAWLIGWLAAVTGYVLISRVLLGVAVLALADGSQDAAELRTLPSFLGALSLVGTVLLLAATIGLRKLLRGRAVPGTQSVRFTDFCGAAGLLSIALASVLIAFMPYAIPPVLRSNAELMREAVKSQNAATDERFLRNAFRKVVPPAGWELKQRQMDREALTHYLLDEYPDDPSCLSWLAELARHNGSRSRQVIHTWFGHPELSFHERSGLADLLASLKDPDGLPTIAKFALDKNYGTADKPIEFQERLTLLASMEALQPGARVDTSKALLRGTDTAEGDPIALAAASYVLASNRPGDHGAVEDYFKLKVADKYPFNDFINELPRLYQADHPIGVNFVKGFKILARDMLSHHTAITRVRACLWLILRPELHGNKYRYGTADPTSPPCEKLRGTDWKAHLRTMRRTVFHEAADAEIAAEEAAELAEEAAELDGGAGDGGVADSTTDPATAAP